MRRARKKNESGQTVVEYLLLLFVIVGVVVIAYRWFKTSEFFFKNVTKPLVAQIRYNYKYGDPVAQGWDEGQPKKHIEIPKPDGQTFRLFMPAKK